MTVVGYIFNRIAELLAHFLRKIEAKLRLKNKSYSAPCPTGCLLL